MQRDEPNNGSSDSEPPSTSRRVRISEDVKEVTTGNHRSIQAGDDIDLEEILTQMGPAGKFQLRNYMLILIPVLFGAMYTGQYVFNASKPDQRCIVNECEKNPPEFKAGTWKTWAIPSNPELARCYRYANKDGLCKEDSFSKKLDECVSWLYENDNSIIAEFNMGCQEWKRTLVGTVHGLGLMTALAFVGTFSDLFGRRYVFIATSAMPSVLGVIRGFSKNYYMYLFFEYLEAIAASGVFSTGYILALEMIGVEKRVLAGSCLSGSYAVGQLILALLAWLIPYWRTLTIVIYAPSILFLSYYFCLEESVRWLLSRGRKRQAANVIFRGAAMNGRRLPTETITYLNTPDTSGRRAEQKKKSFIDEPRIIFRSRILLSRLFVIAFWFASASFVYYGLSINAESLAGNMAANYALLGAVEIPGYIINIQVLDRIGRKKTITVSYIVCAISLSSLPFTLKIPVLMTTLALISKMFISMVFSATYMYVTELAPTEVRHTMMGLGLFIGRLGKSVAPLSPMLLEITPYTPYIVFAISSWLAAALTYYTPETKDTKLPDTLDEAEHLEPETALSSRSELSTSQNIK